MNTRYEEYTHAIRVLTRSKQDEERLYAHQMVLFHRIKNDYVHSVGLDYFMHKRMCIDIRYTYVRMQYMMKYLHTTHHKLLYERLCNAFQHVEREYTRIAWLTRNFRIYYENMHNLYLRVYEDEYAYAKTLKSGFHRNSKKHHAIVMEKTLAYVNRYFSLRYSYNSTYMHIYDANGNHRLYVERDRAMDYTWF